MKNQKIKIFGSVVRSTNTYTHQEMVANVVEPIWAGHNFKALVQFKATNYFELKESFAAADVEKWDVIYLSASLQGKAFINEERTMIYASILDGGGIVGAFYILEN